MQAHRHVKTIRLMIVLGLALAVLLAACDGDADTASSPGDETEDAGTPEDGGDAGETGDDAGTDGDVEAATIDFPIDFVVPYDAGGGYDQYVRLIGPYLGDCLGTDVVPQNEPGAGSLLATNQTSIAQPDGSRIQIFNTIGAISAQLAEAEGANFDLAEFTWLGRIADEPSAVSVAADSEFETFEDLINADRTVRFVATGPGSNEYIFAQVLATVYDFDVELVTGFAGSGEAQASVIQGDADAHVLSLGSSLGPINAGDMRPLVLVGGESHELVPDVPTVYDFPVVEGQEELLDGLVGMVETARAVAGPPGMDEETTQTLRDGLQCALENEEFLQQAEDQERDVAFLPGEETQELIVEVLNAPEDLRNLIAESFEE